MDQFLKTQGTDDRLRQASAWYAIHPITKKANCRSLECRVGAVQVLCVLRGRGPHTVVPLEHDRGLPELAQGHPQGPARAAQQSSAPGHLPKLVLQHQLEPVGEGITPKERNKKRIKIRINLLFAHFSEFLFDESEGSTAQQRWRAVRGARAPGRSSCWWTWTTPSPTSTNEVPRS